MNTKLENKLLLYKKRSIMTKFLGPCNCWALEGGVRGGGFLINLVSTPAYKARKGTNKPSNLDPECKSKPHNCQLLVESP